MAETFASLSKERICTVARFAEGLIGMRAFQAVELRSHFSNPCWSVKSVVFVFLNHGWTRICTDLHGWSGKRGNANGREWHANGRKSGLMKRKGEPCFPTRVSVTSVFF